MSETADHLTRTIDERSLSARGFFDIEPAVPTPLPPPRLDAPTAVPPVSPPSVGVPELPRNIPAVPSPAPVASPFAFSPAAPSNVPGPAKAGSKPRKGGRRTMSWLVILAIIGGGVYAGITYGPDLMARAKGEPTTSEPVAPLAFPAVTPAAVAPRTATFLVEQPNAKVPSVLASLTKGGLNAATKSLAIEYATRGIRVNAVSLGNIKTPMHPAETYDALAKLHPVGRMGEISDIVTGILYLESAPFVTGEILHIDGGQSAGH